jgi:hypothetical protein
MRLTAGVAAIKGTYEGTVSLANQRHPESFTLKAAGAGAPGTVEADVLVLLAPSDTGGTVLTYDADAAVGGPVGGVGQRMLTGVTRKMAGQFFNAVDAHIAGAPLGASAPAFAAAGAPTAVGTPSSVGARTAPVPASAPNGIPDPVPATMQATVPRGVGAVYAGRSAAPAAGGVSRLRDFALGTVSGAAIALAGVLVGWAIGRG